MGRIRGWPTDSTGMQHTAATVRTRRLTSGPTGATHKVTSPTESDSPTHVPGPSGIRANPRRVFRVTELENVGVPQSTSYRRSRDGGPWQRLAPGIVMTSDEPPTVEDLIDAALLHAGPCAVITGMHGARLHGLSSPPAEAPIHVLIPHSSRLQSYSKIVVERTTRLPTPEWKNGFPVAPLPRAVIDGARTWQTRALTQAMLIETVQNGCPPKELISELEHGCRRGTGLPRAIVREMTALVRSLLEYEAFKHLPEFDLPPPFYDVELFDVRGTRIGCPHVWFDDVGLAVEVDSFPFQLSPAGWAAILERNSQYRAHGVIVVQVPLSHVREQPRTVMETIRSAYSAARARARPDVDMRSSRGAVRAAPTSGGG